MDANAYWAAQIRNLIDLLVGWAWPAVVLIANAIFRDEIRGLVGRVKSLEALGTKATFDLDKAKADVALVAAAAQVRTDATRAARVEGPGQLPLADRLAALIQSDPRAAVTEHMTRSSRNCSLKPAS